jgi:hypothetical protein
LLIPALAERGHAIEIALAPSSDWEVSDAGSAVVSPRTVEQLEALRSRFPQVNYSVVPRRGDSDGWRQVAWIVRGLADIAHTANARYAGTAGSRSRLRSRKRILTELQEAREFEPLGRRLALTVGKRLSSETDARRSRLMLRIAARMEDAIPTSSEVDRYIEELAPDLVLATGTYNHVSGEVEYLKSARKLGIPSGIFVASWYNLTSKGSLKFTPERVFVWNEIQVQDAVELHGIPRDRVRATGAHAFDEWFERRPTRSREQLLQQLGLDPAEPYVLYLCSSNAIVHRKEVEFVRRWIEALRSSSDERLRRLNVIVRPYPGRIALDESREVELGFENVVVWPASGVEPIGTAARADFFDALAHSSAVVGINTTSMIEAAILGKSVLTVLVPEFAQVTTLHFQYLLAENGGFLHVGKTLDEHVEQLGRVLGEDELGTERRRRFVESFVRPGGLDEPAAPIGARAIEELAGMPVQGTIGPGTRLLRVALSLEAGLNNAYGSYRNLRNGRRRDGTPPEPDATPRRVRELLAPDDRSNLPDWERLDELEEYQRLCSIRLEHRVPVREPLVLISQVQRSGGTLLSQLFDAHPECHAHPYELHFGQKGGHRWPKLPLDHPERWFGSLFEQKAVEHLIHGYSKPGLKSPEVDVFPFVFLPRLQKRLFDECIAAKPIERRRDVYDCYFTSYFNAWLDNQNLYSGPKRIVTGFTPRTIFHEPSIERFFAAYPDGMLVSLVRDPRGWYGSASRHRAQYDDLDKAMAVWRRSTEAALDAARRFGEQVLVLTYEELVLETEATMERVAERLRISMSPTLLVPTFNGREIRANSSDAVARRGVLAERAHAYREVLDQRTIARIDELAGELYERVRNGSDGAGA